VSAAIAAVAATDSPLWMVMVLTGVGSGLSALGSPAQRALVPRLLPADRLAAGLALQHSSFQLALLTGPAVAGLLTAAYGVTVCFVVDGLTFLAALAGLAGVPATGPADRAGAAGAGAVWAGLRFVVRTPPARGAFLADLAATVLAMPVALFPLLNAEKFGGSARTLGLLTSALAVGGVLASALSGVITRRDRPGAVLLMCGALWGTSLAAIAVTDRLAGVLALIAVAGAADTWAVVSRGTVVQSSTPEAFRGRVAAVEHIVGAAGPQIGGLRAGLVAAAGSGGVALVVGGVTCLAALALIAVRIPALPRYSVQPAN